MQQQATPVLHQPVQTQGAPAAPAATPAVNKNLIEIKSPTPGTFYSQENQAALPMLL